MGAMLIMNYEVTDLPAIEAYREKGGEHLVVNGGGRPVVFTNDTIDLGEGNGVAPFTIAIEYDSLEAAKEAFFGDGYQSIVGERLAASKPSFAQIVETL